MTLKEFGTIFSPAAADSIISRWERGVSLPNKKRLNKIAEYGDMSIDELLYGSYENVVKELIEEANYYSNNGEFKELDLDPKGLKVTLNEISSFYWRYYLKVANENNEKQNHQEKIDFLYRMIANECKNQDIRMTDYKKIFQCIHTFFTDTIFLNSYSNYGFVDYTLDQLLNIINVKNLEYISLAKKQGVSIDSNLLAETNNILTDTMKKVQEKKKKYPNE